MHKVPWICIFIPAILLLEVAGTSIETREISYYLNEKVEFDPNIPSPEEILGYQVGEWHVRHDQLVDYMKQLAESSERVQIEEIGRTYEQRPLLMLTISSPTNLENLETIRSNHLKLSQPENQSSLSLDEMPVVVNLGYSVHGNESSGSNASLIIAYYLAAAKGPEIEDLLDKSIILLDPSLNPDGLSRFSHWANMHRGKNPVGDSIHREHREAWPGGRTNHYWFDLNRDWLLLQHPESKARIRKFHEWKPNVLTDFHEMGTDSTFFFQPGVPERRHPLTPDQNVELTQMIAEMHADILDPLGILYYSQERFDDFYYGKGSTYPDVNGSIGILFEQASSRGHLQESVHGELDFPFTIRNQCLTSLSTLKAARKHRITLLRYQRDFYQASENLAENAPVKAYIFGSENQPDTLFHLLEILFFHQIQVQKTSRNFAVDDHLFPLGFSYLLDLNQPQFRLIQALFEKRTEFPDNIFYDVSTWTLPTAMGIPFAELKIVPEDLSGKQVTSNPFPKGSVEIAEDSYAYVFDWNHFYAPRALNRLLEKDVFAKVATRPFKARTKTGTSNFPLGSIVIPKGFQGDNLKRIPEILETISLEDGIVIESVISGLTPEGIDLGSPNLKTIQRPRPLMMIGSGVSAYEAGEVWHLLDYRMDMNLVMVEMDDFTNLDLHHYTHLIFVSGSYGTISQKEVDRIKSWIRRGGVLIATRTAVNWAADKEISNVKMVKPEKAETESQKNDDPTENYSYIQHEKIEDAKIISGAIVNVNLDITHPIAYGYADRQLRVFRNSRILMKLSDNPYSTVARYADETLFSGYIHDDFLPKFKGSASIIVDKIGKGTVISMVDNPNFRGIWLGTSKLFLNAVFFGSIVESTEVRK
jgi:hypothetical protein